MTCDLARQLVGHHTYVTRKIRSLPRRTDSRSRMIHAATELFRQRGYHATSVSDVVCEGGALRGSTYKQELAREAIARTRDEVE